ncbi:MAG TPA: cytochrome c [Fluviicola sp.]|nr:cytochrome c [Fluviicola sp.]
MKPVLFLAPLALAALITSCRTTEEVSKVEPSKGTTTGPVEEPVKEVGLSADALAGESLFNQHCGRCHDLPKVEDYSADRWDRIVPSMAKKSKLTPEQEASVMTYVKESLK